MKELVVTLYFPFEGVGPCQAEAQEAIDGILCNQDGPADVLQDALREVFPEVVWLGCEHGDIAYQERP